MAAPAFGDGVLVIDKPAGPTSHDVVAVVRRAIRHLQRSTMKVGHTGTLDPMASGVLPVVIGKATRLTQFLTSAEKEYEAAIELGVSTTTLDRTGDRVEAVRTRRVSDLTAAMIDDAVAAPIRRCRLRSRRRRSTAIAPTIWPGGTRR
jgi:tRNA pseudouridine55 synthase